MLIYLLIWLLERSRLSNRIQEGILRWFIVSVVGAFVVGVPLFFFPEFRSPVQPPRPTRINNMLDMARLVFSQYNTGKPICVIPVANLANTFLLLLSGTELKALGQATHFTSDVLASLSIGAFDFFRDSAKKALKDFRTPAGLGLDRANLMMAGHSLGGMEAENLAADPTFVTRYRVLRLITFGKPKTRASVLDSAISRHFLLTDDAVVKWIDRLLFFIRAQYPARTIILPSTDDKRNGEHSNYPVSEALKKYDAMGDPIPSGKTGTFLLLVLNHSACFEADNPKIYCTPAVHTYNCNPL